MENMEEKIDLFKYFDRFYRAIKKFKFLLVLLLIIPIAYMEVKNIYMAKDSYTSKALVIVSSNEEDASYGSGDEDMLSTFKSLLQGSMMNEMLAEKTGKGYVPAYLTYSTMGETNLLTITSTSSNAEDAYNTLNVLLKNYTSVTNKVMYDIGMSVIDEPKLAKSPNEKPNYLMVGLKGLLVGLVLDFALLCAYFIFRHTVLSLDDIQNTIHLKSVAKIPYLPRVKKNQLLVTNSRLQNGFKQSFHDLRIFVEQDHKKNKHQVYLVTSAFPNEGKSTVAANLAISLANKGNKTVLIDLDLRNPSIKEVLQIKKMDSNIAYLLLSQEVEQIEVTHYEGAPLDLICGDKERDNALELLSKPALKKLIENLKREYDYIILDAPPINMMEDTLLISKVADAGVVVVKQDYASIYDILDNVDELNKKMEQGVIGIVLNQVKPSIFDQESSSTGYGYGYGYGYGNRTKK